jgi:hypothetical protein
MNLRLARYVHIDEHLWPLPVRDGNAVHTYGSPAAIDQPWMASSKSHHRWQTQWKSMFRKLTTGDFAGASALAPSCRSNLFEDFGARVAYERNQWKNLHCAFVSQSLWNALFWYIQQVPRTFLSLGKLSCRPEKSAKISPIYEYFRILWFIQEFGMVSAW